MKNVTKKIGLKPCYAIPWFFYASPGPLILNYVTWKKQRQNIFFKNQFLYCVEQDGTIIFVIYIKPNFDQSDRK